MSFVETQFPVDIAYGSSGGPEFSTDIVATQAGFEQRNSNWQQARARFNVAHGVKSQTQLDALIAFFRARKGKSEGFRFKDWTDFEIIGASIGTGDGVTQDFQLVKPYTSGAVTVNRTISKPVSGTVSVYVDSVLKTETTDYTLDLTTGVISFVTPPGVGKVVSVDAEFDVPVRFDTDRLSARLDAYGSYSWLDIPLVEVRG
jgi:uncharacterized protein (TIGR02217 family)